MTDHITSVYNNVTKETLACIDSVASPLSETSALWLTVRIATPNIGNYMRLTGEKVKVNPVRTVKEYGAMTV